MKRRILSSRTATVVSLVVAVLSLYVAWRSLRSEERALEFAHQQVQLAKQQLGDAGDPVWIAAATTDGDRLVFERERGESVLQSITMIYVSQIGGVATDARPPHFAADLRQVINGLRDVLNVTKTAKPETIAATWIEGEAPVLLITTYAFRRQVYNDSSLYMLQYNALVARDKGDWPLRVRGIRFHERLAPRGMDEYSEVAKDFMKHLLVFGVASTAK